MSTGPPASGALVTEAEGRAVVAVRSQGRCEVCSREGHGVHHRVKRSQGGTWDPANLLRLCGDGTRYCHGWVEAHPQHARALGLWLASGADPARHPAYVHPTMFWRDWWWLSGQGMWAWHAGRSMTTPPDDVAAAVASLTAARDLSPGGLLA